MLYRSLSMLYTYNWEVEQNHTTILQNTEFPESLVSDSKGRVSRSRTRLGLRLGFEIQGCSRIGLGLGLVITFCAVLVSEWGHKI